MSAQYDQYLTQHRNNVGKGLMWLHKNLPELVEHPIKDITQSLIEYNIGYAHDHSKDSGDEYSAYDAYFYGGNRSYKVVEEFNRAWLHHIHNNPHHWQHWVLINDDPENGEIILDMPYEYIIEMICDWWAFSWSKGDLTEIFNWYDAHKDYMKLSDKTRKTVEDILDLIKTKLKEKENA